MSKQAVLIFIVASIAASRHPGIGRPANRRATEGAPRICAPSEVTHRYLPLATLKQAIFTGNDGSKKLRVERIARPDLHQSFNVAGQIVEALAMESRTFQDGKLTEVALEYFAQADDGDRVSPWPRRERNRRWESRRAHWLVAAGAERQDLQRGDAGRGEGGRHIPIRGRAQAVAEEDEVVGVWNTSRCRRATLSIALRSRPPGPMARSPSATMPRAQAA